MKHKINYFLKNVYFVSIGILLILIIATPYLIKSNISILREETLEVILIFVMLVIVSVIYRFYTKEIKKIAKELMIIKQENKTNEDKLMDAFKYIGGLNVQLDAIRSVFSETGKYPENKREMKQAIEVLAIAILKIISVDWLLLRIVDTQNNMHTISELFKTKKSVTLIKYEISNKDLLNHSHHDDYITVSSSQENLNIKGFCVLPKIKLTKEQSIMLTAIIDQLMMIFIIFNSKYYKYKDN